MKETLNIIKNDPWRTLHQAIFILVCTVLPKDGRSANGHRMLLIFIW